MAETLSCGLASSQQVDEEEARPQLLATVKEVLQLALPNIFSCLMGMITELINVVFLGHAGDDKVLAAVGLGNMMQNCFGLSIGLGIASALDTLVSQAHGAGQHELSCHYLQRCRVLITLQLIWMVPVLAYSEHWLDAIHQDSIVAHNAGQYNRATVWGLFALFQSQTTMKFVMNRGDVAWAAVLAMVTSLLHAAWCAIFVLHFGWGNAGAGYANITTWYLQLLLTSLYLLRYARRESLPVRSVLWLQGAAFREWGSFMRLAVPGTLQLCSEWWFWELCAVVVGYLGSLPLAAHVATLNWVALSFMPVIGIGMSSATLVGNALGAGKPRKAKLAAKMCVGLDLLVWLILALAMSLGRTYVARAYSGDEDVVALMEKLLCIFALVGFCDSSQNVMGSVLRGIGKQRIAAIAYIISFYFFMLPVGCILAFPLHMGIFGIWASMGLGTFGCAVVFAVRLRTINYAALAREAVARMEREAGATEDIGDQHAATEGLKA